MKVEKETIATFRAATARPDQLTVDRLDAGLGGWSAFDMALRVLGPKGM